jgi:hypothetical protein
MCLVEKGPSEKAIPTGCRPPENANPGSGDYSFRSPLLRRGECGKDAVNQFLKDQILRAFLQWVLTI